VDYMYSGLLNELMDDPFLTNLVRSLLMRSDLEEDGLDVGAIRAG
jgi:hypothetical protein